VSDNVEKRFKTDDDDDDDDDDVDNSFSMKLTQEAGCDKALCER
jgi:hypothetical protein